jgi:protein-S-isoprenylcysteine O-methyltransferase Ste14
LLPGFLAGRTSAASTDAEEKLLRRDLPGYVAYSERTKRLIPFLW